MGAVRVRAGSGRGAQPASERRISDAARDLVAQVNPRWAVLEYGQPRAVLDPAAAREARQAQTLARHAYRRLLGARHVIETETDMAVFIHADETGLRVDRQAERGRD